MKGSARSLVPAACARLGLIALLTSACTPSLPRPLTGPVPPGVARVEVPYPPPPARVEIVPPKQAAGQVWVDGQWDWDGQAWRWLAGRWMTPPAGAYFTPWTTTRAPDGRLLFTAAAWRAPGGRSLGFGVAHSGCP